MGGHQTNPMYRNPEPQEVATQPQQGRRIVCNKYDQEEQIHVATLAVLEPTF
jgi:hypothetical protein